MRLLSRYLFREIVVNAVLGCSLFTAVIYLYLSRTLLEFIVQYPGSTRTVMKLFALVVPQTLTYTIPLGVLVGVLLTLSRKSADGEITAMRAAGVSGRRVATPVMTFAVFGMIVAGGASMWLTPWSMRETSRIKSDLQEAQFNADIEPLKFEERFPNRVLYVRRIPKAGQEWRQVFIADLTPSEDRGNVPEVTLAQEAVAQPDAEHNRVQLSMRNGSTYEANKDVEKYATSTFPSNDLALEAEKQTPKETTRPSVQMDTLPLYRAAYKTAGLNHDDLIDMRRELHQRLALPFACVVLALAGVPLGLGARRRGKSPAVVMTVVLAFAYYLGLIGAIALARAGKLPVEVAMWLPAATFLVIGLAMLARMERPKSHDLGELLAGLWPARRIAGGRRRLARLEWRRFPLLPQIIDAHMVSRFLFYFVLWLGTFILLLDVFNFFDLLRDIFRNQIPMTTVARYLFFLTPRWIYELTPVSVLTTVLVVLGVLSKDNEVTAYKACGVSIYRLAVPLLFTSALFVGALFAFNYYVVPGADRIQNALRAEIKGKPAQTFLNPGQKWIWGNDNNVFYYRYYDSDRRVMANVNVFEIDLDKFVLKRHIVAEAARWEPTISGWVFQNGWVRDMKGAVKPLDNFAGQTRVFPEVAERPDYFVKEKIESEQMNYLELKAYIGELNQGGFDTNRLQVQYFKKFAVPLFAFILALVSAPFGFSMGTRGAMAGVGISFVVYIAYASTQSLFEQLGALGQLPPDVAAWSPDAMFALAGLFLLVRVRS